MRHGRAENPVEALEVANNALSEAEGFIDSIALDIENLIANMQRYNDGDGKDTLLDGIQDFIAEAENILSALK